MTVAGHQALTLTTNQAVAWSAAHPDWFVFPGKMIADGEGGWIKRPLVAWTKRATKDPEEVRRLWDSVGGNAVICVACEPSGIFVIDEDRDVEDATWKSVLDTIRTAKLTLVLKSATKGRPHYVFKQPSTGDPVVEGRWVAGDVKAHGMIMVSSHDPIVDAVPVEAPTKLLDMLKRGPKGSRGRGLATREALNDWLATTPEILILGEAGQRKFLERTVERLNKHVDSGSHRRSAALEAVYHAALEASAGCFPASKAYNEIKDAYEKLRYGDPDPSKGWTPAREVDYDAMWASLVPEMLAGDHDEKIEEIRDDLFERGLAEDEEDDFEDLAGWFELVINDDIAAAERAEAPVSTSPESPAGAISTAAIHESPGQAEGESGFITSTAVSTTEVESEETSKTATPLVAPATGPHDPMKVVPIRQVPLELREEAYLGPFGEFIQAARPYTEAGDPGLLAAILACFGAYYGRHAHFVRGSAIHGPNVFVLGVGESASTRKTTAWATVRPVFFPPAGKPMYRPQKFSGVASGERLLHMWEPVEVEVTDPVTMTVGTALVDAEPRALWYESEISAVFKRTKREGATMAETICQLWDQDDLEHWVRTGPDIRIAAEKYRAGLIGLSTLELIRSHVTTAEAGTGLGNRFLWFYLADSFRDLPEGGTVPDHIVNDFRDKLHLDRATDRQSVVDLTPDAKAIWREIYGKLKRGQNRMGMVEALLNRGEPYVLRIALNYHLACGGKVIEKGSNEVVGVESLKAALAVWDYCRASVMKIFEGTVGDPAIDEILHFLRQGGKGWAPIEEVKGPGLLRTSVERGVRMGVLKKGLLGAGRGRSPMIVGIAQMVNDKTIKYENQRQEEKTKWL